MSAPVVFTRYRYGAGFVDPGSGLRFEGHRPSERPDLWTAYLDGAEARYRHHGVEQVLNRPAIEDGATVPLFWIAFDGDEVVAGARCHGPFDGPDDAHALIELAGTEPLDELRAMIADRLDVGIVELKGVWVAHGRDDKAAVSNTLARCFVHSMHWFGTRYGMCTAADQAIARWSTSGGRTHDDLSPVAYPDDRYQTVLLWWDLAELGELAHPTQLARLAAETAELWASSSPVAPPDADGLDHGGDTSTRSAWKPLLFDPSDPRDSEWIQALIDDPTIEVRDTLIGQVKELRELVPPPTLELLSESPRWVHYDWRRTLIRVVGPKSFGRIRLDRNRNKITVDEQVKFAQLRIGVVGLSVGHVIAYTLALEGLCGELRLADFDDIELSNLNRIPGTTLDLGVNKAVLAARRIAELDPYLPVNVFADGITTENLDDFVSGLDVVIEECDSLDLKMLVREACRREGIPVIMETSDRGMLDVERFDLEPDRPAFHGQLEGLAASDLVGLSTHDKVPFVLRILEPDELSARMAASMAEIDYTVTTWPQLGGDVTLGAATIAAAVRRLGRGDPLPSGRLRIDLDTLLDDLTPPPSVPLLLDAPAPEIAPPPHDFVAFVAHAANLAPSGGNVQPWRFEGDEREFRIYLVPEHSTSMDAHFRGSYVAIGAALFNAQVAATRHGRLGPVELFPSGDASDHVATLHFGDTIDVPLAELYPAMLKRSSNRKAGHPAPIDAPTAALLRSAAEAEGARLRLIDDRSAIDECAELLAESDRFRFLSPRLHQEMMNELRWPGRDALDDGIDVRTLELDSSDLAKLAVARRSDIMGHLASWNAGRALGDVTRERVRASSGLAMITVPGDDPASYVRGGAAVERVWVCAQQAGLAIQPMSPVFIFATDHEDFTQLVSEQFVEPLELLASNFRALTGVPPTESFSLFLRIAHAPGPSYRSARRELADALTVTKSALTSVR